MEVTGKVLYLHIGMIEKNFKRHMLHYLKGKNVLRYASLSVNGKKSTIGV